ncbi:5964_t:CDS:10 [Funneliformis geosporum]|uniref:Mitochondrial import inner membrane translocase subunit TIM50 n=1 Tax=Funneliformis geosporum TaxID=1117311 RepID=A0A9W4STZ7_9GLOM|nr:3606_t:CDS:10 [Funneliformis geosporum]CAI2187873.1 5964_t:CDS:10 [Funneliformis geosporum]
MTSSLSKLRSHNILSDLTRRDCSFLFQTKSSIIKWNSPKVLSRNCQHTFTTQPTFSYILRVENFRYRTLNSCPLKSPITSKLSFVCRQTSTISPPPSAPTTPTIVNLPKKDSRSKPKSSNVDTMSPEAKRVVKILGYASGIWGVGFIIYSGRPFESDRETQYKDLDTFTAWYKRVEARFRDLFHFFTEPSSDKLLPDQDALPPPSPYTLVINLDQTLIYSTWDRENGWRTAKRPGVEYFLYFVAQLFEVVIFTSQPFNFAEQILMKLDPFGLVPYRLYRESTRYIDGKIVKDLSKLNRDLSKVIIMDSNPDAYSLQPENAISVPPWKGDPNDTFLIDIIPFLEHFTIFYVNDVRQVLPQYKGKDIPRLYAEWEEQWKEQQRVEWEKKFKQPKKGLAGWASAFGTQIQEQVPPYEQKLMQIKLINNDINNSYLDYKRRKPEIHQMYQNSMENLEKQIQESMKEKKLTIWDIITQGPPQVPMPDLPSDQNSVQPLPPSQHS